MNSYLITGGAGFIGSHLVGNLIKEGHHVTCIDNFDANYSRVIKEENLKKVIHHPNFLLLERDINEIENFQHELLNTYDVIIHLAAKTGVRPSIKNAQEYQIVNTQGTQKMLDLAVKKNIPHFVFASSSSVYGVNENFPWSEKDFVLQPISPYAVTKINGEMIGRVYSHLYGIRFVALRFFTVYGPRQRPDLAIHKFCKNSIKGIPITLYGDGSSKRDYVYIKDIIQGIKSAIGYDKSNFEIINLGNGVPVKLLDLVQIIQRKLKINSKIDFLNEQLGDVPITCADVTKAERLLNYAPSFSLDGGLSQQIDSLG